MVSAQSLIETFEKSLSHAQGNYQMVILQSLAQSNATKADLVVDLMAANKGKTQSFFNSHCVFRVLINKKLVKLSKSGVYSLNLTKPDLKTRTMILNSATKARQVYEVSH